MPTIWGKYKDRPVERIDGAGSTREAARLLYEYRLAFAALPGQREHGNWLLWVGRKYPIPRPDGGSAC